MDFEALIDEACRPGPHRVLAGAVLAASDLSGQREYIKAFGYTSVTNDAKPLTSDAVMKIASCTKLVTSIAVLQCIERGLFTLDEDATKLLPELEHLQVFTSRDPSVIETKKRIGTITARILLTHQSGLTYGFLSPQVMAWRKTQPDKPGESWRGSINDMLAPLSHEPGEEWTYGTGVDLAGRMVERATGTRLGDFMSQHIFQPLGMSSTTFSLALKPALKARVMPMTVRPLKPNAQLYTTKHRDPESPVDDSGGGGLWSTAPDYLKFLVAVLRNDGILVKPSIMDLLFEPQISDATQLNRTIHHDLWKHVAIPGYPRLQWNACLGGLVLLEDAPGRHAKGTISWGGMPNLIWFVDRREGTCGVFATQLMHPGEPTVSPLKQAFEEGVFRAWTNSRAKIA